MSEAAARIGVWDLFTDALRRLWRAWPATLAFAAAMLGVRPLLDAFPIELSLGLVLPEEVRMARSALNVVLHGVLGAVLLRGLVAGRPVAPRLDRGYLEGVGLMAAFGVVPLAIGFAVGFWDPPGDSDLSARMAVTSALTLATAYLEMRVFLWPIGRLVGHGEVTPGASWGLMRGAVLSYVLVILAIFGAYMLPMMAGPFMVSPDRMMGFLETQRTVITPAYDLFTTLVGLAMSAAIFARRVRPQARLAEVFA